MRSEGVYCPRLSFGLRLAGHRDEAWLKRDCPARSSNAHLAVHIGTSTGGSSTWSARRAGDHRGRSPQVVGHDRGRRRTRVAALVRSVHHRPGRLRGDEDLRPDLAEPVWAVEGSNGAGRPLVQRLLEDGEQVVDVQPSSPPESGSSTPATTARPMPTTRMRSPQSRCAPRRCGCCSSTVGSRRCECSPTAAKP